MQIPFGNNQAIFINQDEVWKQIQNRCFNDYRFNTDYKFQNIKDANELIKINEYKNNGRYEKFMSTLDFGGIKVFLFLTKMDGVNICLFMDRQKRNMYIVNYHFKDELFSDTIFTGELVKRNDNKHFFAVEDLLVLNGKNITINQNIIQRRGLINEILEKSYREDKAIDTHYFSIKNIYLYDNYEDINTYMNDCKLLLENVRGIVYVPSIGNYLGNNYYIQVINEDIDKDEEKLYDTDKIFCFRIEVSNKQEIYYLYLNNHKSSIGIARLPNLESSKYIESLLVNATGDVYVNCKFDKNFQKWVPLEENKKVKEADSYHTVKDSMIEIK